MRGRLGNRRNKRRRSWGLRYWISWINSRGWMCRQMSMINSNNRSRTRTYNTTGSFVTTAARRSTKRTQTTNANSVRTICYVSSVTTWSSTSIHCTNLLFLLVMAHRDNQWVGRYCQSYSHVRHVVGGFHKQLSTLCTKIGRRMCSSCVINVMMRVR